MVWVVDILIMELSDFEMLTGYMMFKCAMRVDLLSQPTYKCNKPYTCDILLHDAKTSPKFPHPRKMLIHVWWPKRECNWLGRAHARVRGALVRPRRVCDSLSRTRALTSFTHPAQIHTRYHTVALRALSPGAFASADPRL
jgi:hypothetical protein